MAEVGEKAMKKVSDDQLQKITEKALEQVSEMAPKIVVKCPEEVASTEVTLKQPEEAPGTANDNILERSDVQIDNLEKARVAAENNPPEKVAENNTEKVPASTTEVEQSGKSASDQKLKQGEKTKDDTFANVEGSESKDPREKDRRGGGRSGWRGSRGRNRLYDQHENDGFQKKRNKWRDRQRRKEEVCAETLHIASLAQKDDKVVLFDCRLRSKSELTNWIRYHKPSVLRRSDGIGYIAILSENCNSVLEERFALGGKETTSHYADLVRDWECLTTDPTCSIDYSTLRALARKHGVCGGKWLFVVNGKDGVDDVWMFICSSVASAETRMPCLAAKITPVHDLEGPEFRGSRNGHMVTVYTRDFTDEDNVIAVEQALRRIPIKFQLTYKPDLFTALGIYRNNKFKLRPTIYCSEWHPKTNTSVVESVFDMGWSYTRVGEGQDKTDGQAKKELEEMVDAAIAISLAGNEKDVGTQKGEVEKESLDVTEKGDARVAESDEDTITASDDSQEDSALKACLANAKQKIESEAAVEPSGVEEEKLPAAGKSVMNENDGAEPTTDNRL